MTSTSTTVASTTPTVIGSFAVTAYGSAKVVVQAKRGTIRHTTELLVVHDGTTAYATVYGTVQTGASLYTINVDVSGGDVRILATSTSATSTVYKTFLTLIKD